VAMPDDPDRHRRREDAETILRAANVAFEVSRPPNSLERRPEN